MSKQRVQVFGQVGKSVVVDTGATSGAVFGVDLRNPDGSLVTASQFASPSPPTSSTEVVYWGVVLEIPANVQSVASLATSGLVVRKSDGSWVTRDILPAAGRTTITNGSGDAGDITFDLDTVADSGSGALQGITRDSYGRVSGVKPVTAGANVTINDVGPSIEISSTGGGGPVLGINCGSAVVPPGAIPRLYLGGAS